MANRVATFRFEASYINPEPLPATYLRYLSFLLVLPIGLLLTGSPEAHEEAIFVLCVTGSRSVDEAEFSDLLSTLPGVVVKQAEKPEVFDLFASGEIDRYAAVLFHDMYQPISEKRGPPF